MKKLTNRLILFFAAVGLCAMIYSTCHYYQQHRAAEATHEYFNQSYPGDTFNPKTTHPRHRSRKEPHRHP
jgi:hypothetical protein